jgi:uncharacterized protein (DUF433 family)
VKTPSAYGGRARIAGHRVRVLDIVAWHEHQGRSAARLAYPVDHAAALAYYYDHISEIQEEMRADRAPAEQMRQEHPSALDAKLRREPLADAS